VRALLLTLMMLAIGTPSSVRNGIARRVVLICFLFAVVGPGQVEAARFRAAQAQLRLLLRHREAGDRHVQVVKSKNSSCQGTNLAVFFFASLSCWICQLIVLRWEDRTKIDSPVSGWKGIAQG